MARWSKRKLTRQKRRIPGAAPGISHLLRDSDRPPPDSMGYRCIDLCVDRIEEKSFQDIDELLAAPRPAWSTTRWIDIQGLHPYPLARLQDAYGIHPLAAEDALNNHQRPKIEDYDQSLYIVLRLLRLNEGCMDSEQISFFYFKDTVITLQEDRIDPWDSVRARMRNPASRFRQHGAPYLLYALLDAVVDHLFPLLDFHFEQLDAMEESILIKADSTMQAQVHAVKRELAHLRQAVGPMRDVIFALRKDDYQLIPANVETYLRDVYDHATRASESIEMFRETANGLQELLIAASNSRMNEVMKALTVMASLFLPLTFFAGIYGMNFAYMPELRWRWAYPAFWIASLAIVGILLFYFKRKGWIGK